VLKENCRGAGVIFPKVISKEKISSNWK